MVATEIWVSSSACEIRKRSVVVGTTDRAYDLGAEAKVVFDRVVVQGDLSGDLDYRGHRLQVESVQDFVGIEVTPYGVEGPVWRGVVCRVLAL